MTEPRFLMPLEERLHADTSGELRASLTAQLQALRDDLLVRRRQLQSRERYRELQAALTATEAALSVLKTLRIRRA